MDVRTGEVRALASLPDYNPNQPGPARESGGLRNRAMAESYELGSAFKAITVAAALDAGAVDLADELDVRGPLHRGGWDITDYGYKGPSLTISEIVQHSSNIGTVLIAEELGLERFQHTLARAQSGQETGDGAVRVAYANPSPKIGMRQSLPRRHTGMVSPSRRFS